MKNIIKIFIIALCLSATACANNSSSTDSVKTDSSTIEISTSSNVDSIKIDSSNEFSEIDSSSISETDSSNESSETDSSETDSSKDESSKAVTTTKTVYKETAKATTTTKQTTVQQTTTQPAVTTKPYVAPTTTTQKPVVTTKATTKQTTKATTKATTKTTTSKLVKPSNLTRYEDALWEVEVNGNYSKTNTKYLEIIRQEAIKYAQNGYIKQYYSALGKFEVNSKMYPFVKNGKPYYVYEKGIVNAAVEFDDADITGKSIGGSDINYIMHEIKSQINITDRLIARMLANACRHGEPDIQWNLTYGINSENQIEWYCITGFACEWK